MRIKKLLLAFSSALTLISCFQVQEDDRILTIKTA